MEDNSFLNQLIQILLPILATFLTGVFTYIGNKLKKTYEDKVNNDTVKTVITDVVKFVEQVYSDIHGKEKLEKAMEQASAILQSKGIKITDAELMMLIESAVYGLNEGLKGDTTNNNDQNNNDKIDVAEDTKLEDTDYSNGEG